MTKRIVEHHFKTLKRVLEENDLLDKRYKILIQMNQGSTWI